MKSSFTRHLFFILFLLFSHSLFGQFDFCQGSYAPPHDCEELYCDDFENYNIGGGISGLNNWARFTNFSDAFVTLYGDPFPSNRTLEFDAGRSPDSRVLWQMDNHTSGRYLVEFKIRFPLTFPANQNQVGYFAFNDSNLGGNVLFEVFLLNGTILRRSYDGWMDPIESYPSPSPTTLNFEFEVDLDFNEVTMSVNGIYLDNWTFQANSNYNKRLGGVQFWGTQITSGNQTFQSLYYLDDVAQCAFETPPSDCSQYIDLSCNVRTQVSTTDEENAFGARELSACSNTGDSYNGPDVIYRFEMECDEPKDVKIDLVVIDGNLDIFLFDDCPSRGGQCLASSTNNSSTEQINIQLGKGTYYLIVDGREGFFDGFGNLKIDAECTDCIQECVDNCQSICDFGGTFVQTGDRFSESIENFERAPSLLLYESCIIDDYGGSLPQEFYAEVFVMWHPEQGPIDFVGFDSGNNDAFRGYLFECICPGGDTLNCNANTQRCLGTFDDSNNGDFDNLPSGFYYIVVTSTEVGTFGFNIVPDGTVCEDQAVDLKCGDSVSGNLAAELNNFDFLDEFDAYSDCYAGNRTFNGNDKYFALTIESPQTVDIFLDTNEPFGLFLYNQSCAENCMTYAETDQNGISPSLQGVELRKGVYYIIIDKAQPGGDDSYTLSIGCTDDDNNIFISDLAPPCTLNFDSTHSVTLRKSANDSLLGASPTIHFLYEDEFGDTKILDTVSKIFTGNEVLFELPADDTTDTEKCAFEEGDALKLVMTDRNRSNEINALSLDFLDPAGGGADARDTFIKDGTSVIEKLSVDSTESFNIQPPFLIFGPKPDNSNVQPILINPTFRWSYELPADATWLTLTPRRGPDGNGVFYREPNAIFVTADENTEFIERSTILTIKSAETSGFQLEYLIRQRGACFIPVLTPVLASNEFCLGENIDISFAGFEPEWEDALSIQWSNGSTDFNFSTQANQVGPGQLSYTVYSESCIESVTASVDYTVISAPNAPVPGADFTICEDQTIPALTVNVSDPSVTVNWYDSPTSTQILRTGPSFTPSTGGTYFAEATTNQSGACSSSSRVGVTLTIIEKPTATADVTQTTICEGQSLTVNGSVSGTDVQVTWRDNAGGSFSNPNDPVTTYTPPPGTNNNIRLTLTASDPSSFCPQATHTITLNVASAPVITSGGDRRVCEGDPIPALTVTVSDTSATVNWYDSPTSTQILGTGTSFTPTASGIYFAEATTNQPGECNNSGRVGMAMTIVERPTATADISQAVVCQGQSLTINGSFTGNNAQITWSDNNAGGSFNNPNNPVTTYTPPPGANNNITLTMTVIIPLSFCPPATYTISVSVIPTPQITASFDRLICEGEPIPALTVLTNSGSAVVDWYNRASGGQLLFSDSTSYTPLVGGTYYAEVRDPQGRCTIPQRTPVTLTIAPAPMVDAGFLNTTICEGSRLQLSGQIDGSATGAVWSTPLSGGNFINPTNLNTEFVPPLGTYTNIPLVLTATEPSGICTQVTDTLFVTVKKQPKGLIDFNDITVCAGDQIDLTGRLLDGAQSPVWTTSVGGGFIPNPSSLSTTYDTPPTGVNEVKIYLTTSDPAGQCIDYRDSAIVRLQEPAVAEAGDNDIKCKGEDFDLNGSISGSATSAVWSDNNIGGIFLPNRNTLNATYRPPAGASNIRLILSTNDPFGSCRAAMDDVDLFVKPAPTITPIDTICSSDRLTYSFEFTVSDGTPSTTNGNLQTISSNRYLISGADANSRLVITVRDDDDCSSDFTVNNPNCDCTPVAPPTGLDQEVCAGDPLPTLTVNVPTGYTTDWYLTATGGTPIAAGTLQYQPTEGGVFYTEAREITSGCSSTLRTEIRLTVHALPPAEAGPDLEICPGESITITAQGDLNYSFSWSNGDTGPSTTVAPVSNQTYTLLVNDGRCENSDQITIRVASEVVGQIDILEEIKCNGGRDGRLVANLTSGTPNFTYRWSNNSILREQIGLSAGNYWVVITDINQCTDSVSIDLTEPAEIETSDVVVTPSSGTDGSITMTVLGGTLPYRFNWQLNGSSFQGGEDIFNLAPGEYSLIITDANDCVFDAGTFTVDPFTSTSGIFEKEFLKVYPNPTGGALFIKTAQPISSDFEFYLFDALGKLIDLPIAQKIGSDAIRFDLNDQASGIYFLKIRTEGKETVRKVIIDK